MDQLSLRLLKTQAGRCPSCGDLLLHANHPPQTQPKEQWVRVTGKALRKQRLTHRRRDGSGETSSLRLYTLDVAGGNTPPRHRPSTSVLPAKPSGLA